MTNEFICWKCTKPLVGVIFPMSRREECSHCQADQHVCLMCEYYDQRMGCNEEKAESVSQLDKANFCDYFKPAYRRFDAPQQNKTNVAKAKLAELFGDPLPETSEIDDSLSPHELAEKKLRELLGDL
ncbi:hypothetical protein [Paraglaciecola sp.]|uniref:hypothetical protein n=1 Tax=Paraglaciecola sp. TaxID=1920173 RepID=UPI0030F468CE